MKKPMGIAERYLALKEEVELLARQHGRAPSDLTIVAVSKNQPLEAIAQAYQAGCRCFAENRIQPALEKMPLLAADIVWHFIGHLQKNKVSKAVGKFALIHSVDTFELAEKLSTVSQQQGICTNILLQVNTSGEATKQGFSSELWKSYFDRLLQLPALEIEGLMTMAPLTDDAKRIAACFRQLRLFREELVLMAAGRTSLRHLSMGMSRDYPIAIAEGATLLRIGTALFEG